jgi:hypothetical protein
MLLFLDTKPGGFNLSNYGDELGVSILLKDLIILIITQVLLTLFSSRLLSGYSDDRHKLLFADIN